MKIKELAKNETQLDAFTYVELIDDDTSCVAIIRNGPKNFEGKGYIYGQHIHLAKMHGSNLIKWRVHNTEKIGNIEQLKALDHISTHLD